MRPAVPLPASMNTASGKFSRASVHACNCDGASEVRGRFGASMVPSPILRQILHQRELVGTVANIMRSTQWRRSWNSKYYGVLHRSGERSVEAVNAASRDEYGSGVLSRGLS